MILLSSFILLCTFIYSAKLYEEKKLDVDAPVQQYVPTFPVKCFNGKPVTITTRQLLSHLGGIRHYIKKASEEESQEKKQQVSQ